jgi:hypothetical protein
MMFLTLKEINQTFYIVTGCLMLQMIIIVDWLIEIVVRYKTCIKKVKIISD